METDIRIKQSEVTGRWMWAFQVGDVDKAGGEADTKEEAMEQAREARRAWEDRSIN